MVQRTQLPKPIQKHPKTRYNHIQLGYDAVRTQPSNPYSSCAFRSEPQRTASVEAPWIHGDCSNSMEFWDIDRTPCLPLYNYTHFLYICMFFTSFNSWNHHKHENLRRGTHKVGNPKDYKGSKEEGKNNGEETEGGKNK